MNSGCKTENVVLNGDLPNREIRDTDKKFVLSGEKLAVEAENASVLKLIPILLGLPCFYALFEQQYCTWEQQAEKMDTWFFKADQMNFWNPVLIIFLIPLFNIVVYPLWRYWQPSLHPLQKITVGMIFTFMSFMFTGFLQLSVDAEPGKVSVFWQLPQYIFITIGEILVTITMMEFLYLQAPPTMKTIITSLQNSMLAIGNICAGLLYTILNGLSRASMFFLFAVLMLINILVFVQCARQFKFTKVTML